MKYHLTFHKKELGYNYISLRFGPKIRNPQPQSESTGSCKNSLHYCYDKFQTDINNTN